MDSKALLTYHLSGVRWWHAEDKLNL